MIKTTLVNVIGITVAMLMAGALPYGCAQKHPCQASKEEEPAQTEPTVQKAPAQRFIVTADSGLGSGPNTVIMGELVTECINQQVDFVVFPGDMIGFGNTPERLEGITTWRDIMQPVYDAGIDVYAIPGNHELADNYTAGVIAWNNTFSGPYALPDNGPADDKNMTYSVTQGNVFLLCLSMYANGIRSQVNQDWIDAQLAANTRQHIFAFGHEPAFGNPRGSLARNPDKRDAFWGSLQNAGARVYFSGHGHFYNHASFDNDSDPDNDVHQVIVGTAGAAIYTRDPSFTDEMGSWTAETFHHAEQFGYVLVEINGVAATLTWMERVAENTYQAMEQWSYTANVSID